MASSVFTLPFVPALGTNGTTQSGAKLYFYDAGTLNARAVYTDAALSIPQPNPVQADGAGRFSTIYLDPAVSYRIILKDAVGVQLGDIDNYTSDPLSASLAGDAGSSLVGFLPSGTGAVARTVASKLGDTISVRDFGAVGDGVTDDTAAIQAAFDAASDTGKELFIPAPSVSYRLTAQIDVPAGIRVRGEGVTISSGGSGSLSTPSVGSWFFLDHVGIGFYCADDVSPSTTKLFSRFTGIGTYRTQPAPAAAWAPTASGADFHIAHRCLLEDVFLLNPYDGVKVADPGVLWVNRLQGQPLHKGIDCDKATDRQNWRNIHFWPYWSQDANVVAYTMVNGIGATITRADGLNIAGFFSWGYLRTLKAVDAAGYGSGLAGFHFADFYGDNCGGVVEINASNYAADGSFVGILGNSDAAVRSSGPTIHIHGAVASQINILGLSVQRSSDECLKVEGAAHVVQCQSVALANWDRRATGVSAFKADNGATINLLNIPNFRTGLPHYTQANAAIINLPSIYRSDYAQIGYSYRIGIADDGIAKIALPPTSKTALIELVPDNPPGAGVPAGVYWVRGTASPSAVKRTEVTGVTNVDLSTGVCTGTTGTDGNFRISPANDGYLYLENRTGVARTTTVIVKGV